MAKSKNKKIEIIYYEDELNDDFAKTKINKKVVNSKFKFVKKNLFWLFCSNFVYYIFAIPFVWIYTKIKYGIKFENLKALKELKKKNIKYYLYGNHTGSIDAFTPNLISFPRRNKMIVSAETVSIKGLKNLVQMLGAIPIPTGNDGIKDFVSAIDYYNKKYNITIYPEAHIWPYYKGVRNFSSVSFSYPVKHNSPVVAFFTVYNKPKGILKKIRKSNVKIYVSDPIYPNLNKNKKEAQKELRDQVYNFMKNCSEKYCNYTLIKYKHISEKDKNNNIKE